MRIVIGMAFIAVSFLCSDLKADGLSGTDCPNDPLAFYQANFSSVSSPCANGILNFSGFNFLASGTPAGSLKTSSDIELLPVGPARGELGDTGFNISAVSGIFSVGIGETATYVIDWHFDIDAGPSASGANLGLDPPFGDVTITQDYCVDSFISAYSAGVAPTCFTGRDSEGPPLQSLMVTTDLPFASIVFNPIAYSFADVRTIIQLNGGPTGAGFDSISGTSTIEQAPETGTWLLFTGGLAMVCITRKRIVSQQS